MNTRTRIATALIGGELVFATALGVGMLHHSAAVAYAEPVPTIDLTTVDDIDVLPACQVEDCSDVPEQIGVWTDPDTGNAYLERGPQTWLIVDDTVRIPVVAHGVAAADDATPGPGNGER